MLKSLLKKLTSSPQSATATTFCQTGGTPSAKTNIGIIADSLAATYSLSFDFPLSKLTSIHSIYFVTLDQKTLDQELDQSSLAEIFKDIKLTHLIVSRYGGTRAKEIVTFANENNIKLIYHIDDDLLNLPRFLGPTVLARHNTKAVLESRHYLLENCHKIYASTEFLASQLQSQFSKQSLFSGIYAPYLADQIKKEDRIQNSTEKIKIGYMGSQSHQFDLNLVIPALEKILNENENVFIDFFGTIEVPSKLEKFEGRVVGHKAKGTYSDFLQYLYDLNWDYGLAPLLDHPFNRCKAPTKYIEYSACGICTIASDITPYSTILNNENAWVVNEGDWYKTIKQALDSHSERANKVELSQNYCQDHFSIETLSNQLKEVLEIK